MSEENITIDELAIMVKNGFDAMDKRFDRLEKQNERMDNLEQRMKRIEDALVIK